VDPLHPLIRSRAFTVHGRRTTFIATALLEVRGDRFHACQAFHPAREEERMDFILWLIALCTTPTSPHIIVIGQL
jgi:hypothetical protein